MACHQLATAASPVHPPHILFPDPFPPVQFIETDTFGCYSSNNCFRASDKCQRRYSNDTTGSCRTVRRFSDSCAGVWG